MALRQLTPPSLALAGEPVPDLAELLEACYHADLQLVRYIDRRKVSMPPDLAAFATVLRDARLQAMRHIERQIGIAPYERK